MAESSLVIGFDLGGTKMHAAVVDAQGHVLHEERQKTQPQDGPVAVVDRMIGLCVRLQKELGDRSGDLGAICVGVPGAVDDANGIVERAPNLGWQNLALAQKLSKALSVPVFLDNDVRVAVLGELAYGVGRGARTMVGIFVGTGIGGGVVVDGRLLHGRRGMAGHVGHIILPCGSVLPVAQNISAWTRLSSDARPREAHLFESLATVRKASCQVNSTTEPMAAPLA